MDARARASGNRSEQRQPASRRAATARTAALAALAGVLYALAFPPFSVGVLGFVALAPLLGAVRRTRSVRGAAACGLVASVAACLLGYAWIAVAAQRFWNLPWVAAGFLGLLYGLIGELPFVVFALVYGALRRRLAAAPAAVTALLFALIEAVLPKIFPDALGHATLPLPALASAAALVGVHGLSFLLAWVAACVVALWAAWRPAAATRARRRRAVAEAIACAAVLAALWGVGAARQARLARLVPDHTLDVAIVQSNIGDPVALADSLGSIPDMVDSIVGVYVSMTREALREAPADLVVWPETAVPASPRDVSYVEVQEVVREFGVPLAFGAYDFLPRDDGTWKIYNALFFMDASGVLRDHYYKHQLIPLGEYVPLSNVFPKLLELLPSAGEFSRGPGPRSMDLGEVRIAPVICYELLFPRYVRRALERGDEVILNLTNDWWFGPYEEPEQHLQLARMRSFELERPIVRATNTGISGVIDARGRLVARSGLWQEQVLRARLEIPPSGRTPYARWGEAASAALALLGVGLGGVVWIAIRPRR